MTSKERAKLRSQAQHLNPVVMVGREGLTDGVINALSEALEIHELVKVRFQDFKENTRELSEKLASETESELIAVTGFTSVFWKENTDK